MQKIHTTAQIKDCT